MKQWILLWTQISHLKIMSGHFIPSILICSYYLLAYWTQIGDSSDERKHLLITTNMYSNGFKVLRKCYTVTKQFYIFFVSCFVLFWFFLVKKGNLYWPAVAEWEGLSCQCWELSNRAIWYPSLGHRDIKDRSCLCCCGIFGQFCHSYMLLPRIQWGLHCLRCN